MRSFCILILAALCSHVWSEPEPSPSTPTITTSTASSKVKRQYSFGRPPNYSPFVGDAARRNADANAQIISQVDQRDANGNYNYAYETTNGIKTRQTSYMVGNDRVTSGYYSYIGPDSKVYTVHYVADRFGYRATGSHLPVQDSSVQPLPPQGTVNPLPVQPIAPPSQGPFGPSTPGPFISSTPGPFGPSAPFISSTPGPFGPSTPATFGPSTPGPFISSTPGQFGPSTPGPFVSSTQAPPFISSTQPPFVSSTRPPFLTSSPYNTPYVPANSFVPSTPYHRRPIGPYNDAGYSSTPAPLVSSSTPFPTISNSPSSYRPHFPIYTQTPPPFQGYRYTNPRINDQYSHVSQQTPAPIFYTPTQNRFSIATAQSNRVTTTYAPQINDPNGFSSTTRAPFDNDPEIPFKEYIPPVPIISSTPRPFNSISPNQPNTVLITPKPFINQQRLPNSLSINQNLVPPFLSVGPLNSAPGRDIYRSNGNAVSDIPFGQEERLRVENRPPGVAPLTVTNINFRKK